MRSTCLPVYVFAACCLAWTSRASADEPADRMQGKSPGDVRTDNGLTMPLVWCPPGAVAMEDVKQTFIVEVPRLKELKPGDNDADSDAESDALTEPKDEPVPAVRQTIRVSKVRAFVTRGYWLGKYEVTQSEWTDVMQTEPWLDKDTIRIGMDFPATFVDWNDAVQFCRRLTQREREAGRLPEGWEYTLPTEVQWERACRARTETRFSFGDDETQIGEYAWTIDNTVGAGEDYAHRVGQKKPNPWGLHDMHGNVWEWCRDVYVEKLPGGRDPEVAGYGANRVLRGGGIYRHAPDCRSAYRNHHKPDWRLYDLGFRVALCRTK